MRYITLLVAIRVTNDFDCFMLIFLGVYGTPITNYINLEEINYEYIGLPTSPRF